MLLDSGKKIGQFCYSEKAKYVGKCIVQFSRFHNLYQRRTIFKVVSIQGKVMMNRSMIQFC